MPPTRGHDLKRQEDDPAADRQQMPPTRGHDLKLESSKTEEISNMDAPHTGARLETDAIIRNLCPDLMPPTRGHDLKQTGGTKNF